MIDMNRVVSALGNENLKFIENFSLKNASTFKIGGECALAVFPKNEKELISALRLLDSVNVRTEIVGRGSNLLFADGRLDMALIFTSAVAGVKINGTEVYAECGASLTALSHNCAKGGLSGLEFACGIPGSVGGAVYMNAGAYGKSISEVLVSSIAYDRKSGCVEEIFEHNFDYRHSVYMDRDLVCLGARLKLQEGDPESIKASNAELLDQRRQKQPLNLPSAGSYFKRPEGYFAGKLIDDLGLKGTRVGDAAISDKHAGFIVNLGNASFDDVMRLEEQVKNAVFKEFGVELCREVVVIK